MLIKAESLRQGLPAPYVGGHVQVQKICEVKVIKASLFPKGMRVNRCGCLFDAVVVVLLIVGHQNGRPVCSPLTSHD